MRHVLSQGYGRKGAALHGMGRFDDAIAAYEMGLKAEPGLAMLTNGLEDAKREATKSEYSFKPGLNYYAFGSPAS